MAKQKICTVCSVSRSTKEFHKCKKAKDGLHTWCKKCCQEYQRQYKPQYYQKHKFQRKQYAAEQRKTLKGHLRNIWYAMLHRCNKQKFKQYKDYGGRGIQVKFSSFGDFYDYIVKTLKIDPRGLTVDRINNDAHYERGNIRFVTMKENCQNRRRKR